MNSRSKSIGILKTILLFVVLPALAIACVMLYVRWNDAEALAKNLKARRDTVVEKIAVDAQIIARKIDKDSLRHVTIAANDNEYTPADLNKTANILDTTALAIGILKKQIKELTVIATTSQAQKLRAYALLDSQKRITYMYRDRFLSLAYRPPVNLTDSLDKGEFDFAYNDSLTVTQYDKRNWFLGQKKSYIDIYSNDPRTTVNGVKRLVVEQQENRFGLRIQAKAGHNFGTGEYIVGPQVRMELGRLSLMGSYMYEPRKYYQPDLKQDQRFKWQVYGTYDIVKF